MYRLEQSASSSAANSSGGTSVAPKAWYDLVRVTLGEALQALTSWESAERLYFVVSHNCHEMDSAVVRCWGGSARFSSQRECLRQTRLQT